MEILNIHITVLPALLRAPSLGAVKRSAAESFELWTQRQKQSHVADACVDWY